MFISFEALRSERDMVTCDVGKKVENYNGDHYEWP